MESKGTIEKAHGIERLAKLGKTKFLAQPGLIEPLYFSKIKTKN